MAKREQILHGIATVEIGNAAGTQYEGTAADEVCGARRMQPGPVISVTGGEKDVGKAETMALTLQEYKWRSIRRRCSGDICAAAAARCRAQ